MDDGVDFHDSGTDVAEKPSQNTEAEEPLGAHAPFDWTNEPCYRETDVIVPDEFDDDGRDVSPLSEDARKALLEIDSIAERNDVAPRRIEIEQAWQAGHYKRGYQFLLHNKKGGWTFPGSQTGYSANVQWQLSNVYQTNVYGEKGEIITAALAREVPKVEFFPANPDHAPDQNMADVADDLKDIWAKNNNLQEVLQNVADLFWTDDRVLLWTRYELNGDEYGYEEPDQPVVPETENAPPAEGTGDEGDTEYEIANESVSASPRKPRGRVRTTAFGKLAHRVPLNVDSQFQMGVIPIYEDKDVALARAQFPWMKDKIQGGGDGSGETELARIARENVRQAVPGSYVTGDAINRHCVVKHSYIRQAMFYDECVNDAVREELLAKFPAGVVLVKVGKEFAFARNECMDDHIGIGHPFPGQGQNRRALGESLLPIQDYINELVSLALDFAKRTVAKKWMDAEAFDVQTLRNQTNVPGSIGPFNRVPGVAVDQLIFIEPTPTPQPWLISWIQWIITSLSEQISGALPSLFGASITGQVGSEGVAIQRDQALQRVGCPWNAIQALFAQAARQAAMLTARCANSDINDVIPGRGRVTIKLNDLKGNVLCYPEANPEFPESWAQKEQRLKELLDMALKSPDMAASQMVLDPKNLKQFQSGLRLRGFVIKGAASVEKQEAEFEILLRSGPMPNPQVLKMKQVIDQATQGMAQHLAAEQSGQETDPQEAQQVQQAPAMLNQLEQQMNALPPMVSTVQVRDDGSQDNSIEAGICFDWLNGPNGRKFQYGDDRQKAAFANVLLHWTEETAAAKKVAAMNTPPPQGKPPSISIAADKMPPDVQADIVAMAGIKALPQDFAEQQKVNTNAEIAKKVVPDQVYLQGMKGQQQDKQKEKESDQPPQDKL